MDKYKSIWILVFAVPDRDLLQEGTFLMDLPIFPLFMLISKRVSSILGAILSVCWVLFAILSISLMYLFIFSHRALLLCYTSFLQCIGWVIAQASHLGLCISIFEVLHNLSKEFTSFIRAAFLLITMQSIWSSLGITFWMQTWTYRDEKLYQRLGKADHLKLNCKLRLSWS